MEFVQSSGSRARIIKRRRAAWWPWALAVLAAGLIAVGIAIANSADGLALVHDRRVVYDCWRHQQKTSLAPEAQQFIAVFCEHLEKQYTQLHGRAP
jgi:hypothetical protein